MIEGVTVKKLIVRDDVPDADQKEIPRGILMEILRADDEFFRKFGQSTMSVAHKGTIKGFHWHEKQDDLWFIATGKIVVVLYDMRPESSTYRQTDTLFAGRDDYKLILIPTGDVHGYKV